MTAELVGAFGLQLTGACVQRGLLLIHVRACLSAVATPIVMPLHVVGSRQPACLHDSNDSADNRSPSVTVALPLALLHAADIVLSLGADVTGQLVAAMGFPLTRAIVASMGEGATSGLVSLMGAELTGERAKAAS